MHCPLTKAREDADGRLVWATPPATSKGFRVTVDRRWAAFTAREEEKDRHDEVDDFHTPWEAQAGEGEGRDRVKRNSVWQVGEKRLSWMDKVYKCGLAGTLGISVFVKHNSSAP